MITLKAKVCNVAARIPRGKVLTYRKVAELAGCGKAWRAVGNILNKNRDETVYCHRVVRSDGGVGGYAHGTAAKIEKLVNEGIEIKNKKVDLKRYLWKA